MRRILISIFVAAGAALPVSAQDGVSTSSITVDSGTIDVSGTTESSDLNDNGSGTLTLGTNTYTGGTVLTGGTLIVSGSMTSSANSDGTLAGSGVVVSGGTLASGGTTVSTGTAATGGTFTLSGTTDDTSGAVFIMNNGGSLGTNNGVYQLLKLTTITSAPPVTIGPASKTLLLYGVGGGTTANANANDITGDVNISSGTLQVSNGQGLGAGSVTVQAGGTLSLNGQAAGGGTFTVVTLGNNLTINGTGSIGQGAITNAGGSNTISGTLTLGSNATVGNSTSTLGSLSLGNIALSGNTLTVNAGTFLTGTISGTGGLSICGTFVGIYGGNNTFTGTTDVTSGSELICSNTLGTSVSGDLTIEDRGSLADFAGNQLSASTVITLNGSAEFYFSNANRPSLTETIAGLQGTSATSAVAASCFVGTADDTLTLSGSGTYSYAGQITDTSYTTEAVLNLVKQGPGTQILSGPATYYGPTTVNGGALVFTQGMSNTEWISTAAGATLNLASGTFYTTGTITNDGTLILGNGVNLSSRDTFTNNGTLDLRHDPTFVFPANFVNNGTILMAGPQNFSGWASAHPNMSNQTTAGAPLKDGVPNVLKYLFDIDPTRPMNATDRAALPALAQASNGNLTLTFRESPTQTGLTVNVQTSTDLVHWSTLPQSQTPSTTTCTMQQVSTDTVTNDAVMQVSVQPSGAITQFLRLGVTAP